MSIVTHYVRVEMASYDEWVSSGTQSDTVDPTRTQHCVLCSREFCHERLCDLRDGIGADTSLGGFD